MWEQSRDVDRQARRPLVGNAVWLAGRLWRGAVLWLTPCKLFMNIVLLPSSVSLLGAVNYGAVQS